MEPTGLSDSMFCQETQGFWLVRTHRTIVWAQDPRQSPSAPSQAVKHTFTEVLESTHTVEAPNLIPKSGAWWLQRMCWGQYPRTECPLGH